MHIYIHIHTYIYIHTYIHTSIHTHIHIHTHTRVWICQGGRLKLYAHIQKMWCCVVVVVVVVVMVMVMFVVRVGFMGGRDRCDWLAGKLL